MTAATHLGAPGRQLLRDALARCRSGFAAVLVFSFCINLLMLAVPLYMLQIFDRVLASHSTDTLLLLTVIAIAALLAMGALQSVRGFLFVRMGSWIDQRLAGALLAGSIDTALRDSRRASVQSLRDLATVRTFLTGSAVTPILDAPWTPIFLAVIFLMHPLLGWIALAGAIVLLAIALANELWTRRPLERSSAASTRALQSAQAAVRNADVVQAMGMTPALISRWHRQNADTLALGSQAGHRNATLTGAARFLRMALQVGVLGTGAWLVLGAEITPGAMISASILMGRALAPVDMAIGAWRAAVAARDGYARVRAQLEEFGGRGSAMPLPAPSGRLAVDKLTYFHPGASEPLLRNVGLALEPGEALGLIGPSAAGKTTLARLMVGNLAATSGHVRLDDMDVAAWDPDDLGPHIGYLPQDIELFAGTVRDNIARMGEADPDAVIEAARLAGAHDVMLRLPNGYDTEIGEAGTNLSGGERQRVALARAVFGGPRLVVLDEPDASLDQTGNDALLALVEALKARGTTVVLIAHRPSMMRHVDKILVLRHGQVELYGPRDQVLARVVGPAPHPGAAAAGVDITTGMQTAAVPAGRGPGGVASTGGGPGEGRGG